MRDLFCARPGKKWVGWDADSLEAKCEAHYVYEKSPEAALELTDGDIHTKNLRAIKPLKDRDHAKTLKYGITYGAQAAKVASILGVPKDEGEKWFEKFWEENPELAEVREDAMRELKTLGYVTAIDGRRLEARSPHSALNFRFQSCGAIVMKYAMVIAHLAIKKKFGDKAHGLIRYHDEEIWECDTVEIAEQVGKLGELSVQLAGKYLNMNVPLSASAKIGYTWADIH
jgi:DNA polymerase I-like protein with 3'-5' exonuclease and polymerase domains